MGPNKSLIGLCLAIILFITFAAFYPSLKNGFTNWDDEQHVLDNESIKTLTWKSIAGLTGSFLVSNYIPLTALTYMLEYRFFKANPFIYHATNLAFHLLNCMLVFWLVYLIGNGVFVAFFTSLLFGIHPLHVESVAWVSERKDVLYAFFFLGSLICYAYYLKKLYSLKYYFLSILFFLLSLLSKPMAVSLPLLLFLTDYAFSRRFNTRVFVEKAPFFILTTLFSFITFFAQQTAITDKVVLLFPDNLIFFCFRLVFYLIKVVLPVGLSCFYPYPDKVNGVLPPAYLVSPAILVSIIVATILLLKLLNDKRLVVFGIFFLITILPVLQILPAGLAIAADRYTYLPYVGIFIVAGKGLSHLIGNWTDRRQSIKVLLGFFSACLLCALAFLTWQRCSVWRDSITLWTDVPQKYPSFVAYNNRGGAYFAKGEFTKAIDDFNEAVRKSPRNPDPYNNLCRSHWKLGQYQQALVYCQKAIALKSDYAEAYNNLGNVYLSMGRNQEAAGLYERALHADPNYATAHSNLCGFYQGSGQYQQALVYCQKAIALKPDYAEAYNNLGNVYLSMGRNPEAIELYKKALDLDPGYAPAHNNLSVSYYYRGQYQLALRHYEKAVELGYKVNQEFADLVKARFAR